MTETEPRKGMPSPKLEKDIFRERFLDRFRDPAYRPFAETIDQLAEIAWQAYQDGRKSPTTRKAGPGFADPNYDLSVDWIAARAAIERAQIEHDVETARRQVLLVNGSPRSEHTCPGEMSKTWRLLEIARRTIESAGCAVRVLDLSRLASEYGRNIHPCKSCFSTAAALCHWPCSCYPNHSLGQVQDWMNDIYPMWVAAHGVMLVTPVHWYFGSSPLKLMMDRMVCADGGNPDPTKTHGKNAKRAKEIELAGWDYPRHLQGRLYSVVVHGDTEGAENVRRSLCDWLSSLHLQPAGEGSSLDRYIGYWEPYATSHDALDRDLAIEREVALAAKVLADAVQARPARSPEPTLDEPRKK
jgi:multimeric flavodoxin WrbA